MFYVINFGGRFIIIITAFPFNVCGGKVDYPYLFQTCGFSRVDDIRAELESQSDWDWSPSPEITDIIQMRAANSFGFFAPFSPEQKALTAYLKKRQAGQMISTYAWGLFADVSVPERQYA